MTASVTIQRAGTYRLIIWINDVQVIGSPFDHLEVEPTDLDGSLCAVHEFPELMYVGFEFDF